MPRHRLSSTSPSAPGRRNRGPRPARDAPAPTSANRFSLLDSLEALDIAAPRPQPPPLPILTVSVPVINPSPPPPVNWPLFDQSGRDGTELGNSASANSADILVACTSRGVKFGVWFQSSGGTLALHTRCEEMSGPGATRSIKILSDVICSHYQLVLLRVCSTNINSPRDFFVYSFRYWGKDASIQRIPKFLPKSSAVSQSFGLLRDQSNCDEYVVAILEMLNPKKGCVEVLLHRCWPSSKSWSSRLPEKVILASIIDMRKWQTDQVIPYRKDLLWADLKQGILFGFRNLLHKDTEVRTLYLPNMNVRRPETFMTVGCCNGKLKFVILDISNVSEVVTIMTFSESSYKKREPYWHKTSQIYLNCIELWANMPFNLELSECHMPCFPVLHTDKDNILYLTTFKKDKDNKHAWLLQLDMKATHDSMGASAHQVDTESDTSTEVDTQLSTDFDTSTESNMEYWPLVDVIDYPGFCHHQKPPFPATASD